MTVLLNLRYASLAAYLLNKIINQKPFLQAHYPVSTDIILQAAWGKKSLYGRQQAYKSRGFNTFLDFPFFLSICNNAYKPKQSFHFDFYLQEDYNYTKCLYYEYQAGVIG